MSNLKTKRLGDIVNFKRGYDLPEYQRSPGPYPVISSAGISGCHNEYKVEGEGIVTGRYGTLGKMYYIDGKYWPHNTTLYVTDFKGNIPKYIYYLLTCLGRIRTSDKSAVPGVNRNELHEMVVPVIDNKVLQANISNVLSSIDQKIELNNRIYDELKSLIKILYDYWFIQFDFPDHNGKPYKSSGGKMVYNKLLKRKIPERWVDCKLSDVIDRTGTGLNPRNNFKLGSGENYYITITNISNGKIIFDEKCDRINNEALITINNRSKLKVGDILFTSIEPVGETYLIHEEPNNWNINESVFTIRANYKKITSEYLYMLLSSVEMKKFTKNVASGSIHKGIRHEVLKSFVLPYSDPVLIERFSSIIKPLLNKAYNVDKENIMLIQLRDWLLPMLMIGQVTLK